MIASSRKPPSDVMGLFIQTCDINLDESIFCSNIITLFASKTPYEAIKVGLQSFECDYKDWTIGMVLMY